MSDGRWEVPLSDVVVDEELVDAVAAAVRSGWWSMGPRVALFEERFAAACEARHAVAVANGTAALHLALLATGCGPGDDVVLPSLTFVAAANAIAHTGARPVFCDIVGEDDLNLDPVDLEAALTPATKAVVVLHYGGSPCDLDAVSALAARHGVAVIEDAAHAPGGLWDGRACGTIGTLGCFSFFSNKNLPVGEGGMIVTDDDALAASVRLLRSHGMTTLTWDRHRGHAHAYDVVAQGFNYRLDEIHAALGIVQLGRLGQANEARARHAGRYRELLDGTGGIAVPFRELDVRAQPAHHLAAVVLPEGVDREHVREALADERIQTSVHYPPIHRFTRYAAASTRPLPHTDGLADRLLTLPLYSHMRPEQVELVSERLLATMRSPVPSRRMT